MRDLLFELLYKESYKKGEFTLSSGKTTDTYIDITPVALSPNGRDLITNKLLKLCDLAFDKENDPLCDAFAGVVLGGGALCVDLSIYYNVPAIFVRKQSKKHGAKRLIEKPYSLDGKDIILIEDVVTTGKSSINAIKVLQDDGFNVKTVLSVVDRQEGGKKQIMLETGIKLYSLYTKEDFLNYGRVDN